MYNPPYPGIENEQADPEDEPVESVSLIG